MKADHAKEIEDEPGLLYEDKNKKVQINLYETIIPLQIDVCARLTGGWRVPLSIRSMRQETVQVSLYCRCM